MGLLSRLFGKKQDNTASGPLEKAVKLEKAGKSGETVKFYKSYIEVHKGHVEAYQNSAALYGKLGMRFGGLMNSVSCILVLHTKIGRFQRSDLS